MNIWYGLNTKGEREYAHKLVTIRWLTVTSYKDHFEQRPLRTRETISYKDIEVTSNKDFLYEVVPEFLHTHAEESFHTKTISYKDPRVNFLFEF